MMSQMDVNKLPGFDETRDTGLTPSLSSAQWTIGSTDGTYAASALGRHTTKILPPKDIDEVGEDSIEALTDGLDLSSSASDSFNGAVIGATGEITTLQAISEITAKRSLYHNRLLHPQSSAVEACLSGACEVMGFDIAEMWLRTGPKTHQLTNSHLRPSALEDSVRNELVDVYYGERSSERTHLLSPALCKRAKEAKNVVWMNAQTPSEAEALRISISDVRTAVALPVCHAASNTNITIIFFSIRRNVMKPTAVEFLVHMSLGAAVASVNDLADEGLLDVAKRNMPQSISKSDPSVLARKTNRLERVSGHTSITGANLNLQWRDLHNVEYLTDGGNNRIHTAVLDGKAVVVKTLKPEYQDVAIAINEIESELALHSRMNHPNICTLLGAGTTSKGVRFVVLERLDGGTLSQMLGYDIRIRDRRRRFWRKKQFSYLDVLRCGRSMADAMAYMHECAIPGCMLIHRDIKPDNIGFTLAGEVKMFDFGLARMIDNADPSTDEVYEMSGETGSLRYMAPEVAKSLSYNHKADVYSFGIILWELTAYKKPFEGMGRDDFYVNVVWGGERPPINKKWPGELSALMASCWSENQKDRPTFSDIVVILDKLLSREKGSGGIRKTRRVLSGLIDRHSTWF